MEYFFSHLTGIHFDGHCRVRAFMVVGPKGDVGSNNKVFDFSDTRAHFMLNLFIVPFQNHKKARYQNLNDFMLYFENTYLNGNFPPVLWNVYARPMELRTNNAVESYHGRWNQRTP